MDEPAPSYADIVTGWLYPAYLMCLAVYRKETLATLAQDMQ